MKRAIKRIEIIIPALESKRLLKRLAEANITGYSLIRNVTGNGDRGNVQDDIGRGFANDYILTVCSTEEEAKLLAMIQPLLSSYGGVCIVSDAEWLIHEHPLF